MIEEGELTNDMNKVTTYIIAGLVTLAVGFFLGQASSSVRYGDVSTLSGGLAVLMSSPTDTFTVGSSTTTFLIQNSGTLYTGKGETYGGGVYSTSTASSTATATLLAAAFSGQANLVSYTSGTSTAMVLTLPASSTFPTTYLANSGDSTDIYLYAASTTGGTLRLAAGTGSILSSIITAASTTAATTTIQAGKIGILHILRTPDTNLQFLFYPAQ